MSLLVKILMFFLTFVTICVRFRNYLIYMQQENLLSKLRKQIPGHLRQNQIFRPDKYLSIFATYALKWILSEEDKSSGTNFDKK
jgi:hypothetical protein